MEKVLTFYYTHEKKFKIRSKTILRVTRGAGGMTFIYVHAVSSQYIGSNCGHFTNWEGAGFGFLDDNTMKPSKCPEISRRTIVNNKPSPPMHELLIVRKFSKKE